MFPVWVGNWQFGPAGTVNFRWARSPTRRVAAICAARGYSNWTPLGPACGNVWR